MAEPTKGGPNSENLIELRGTVSAAEPDAAAVPFSLNFGLIFSLDLGRGMKGMS